MADLVAVMARGAIEQCAAPELLYAEPATPFVATFVGMANLLPGESRGGFAETRLGRVRLLGPGGHQAERRVLVVVRPEHVEVAEAPDGLADADAWRIVGRRFSGTEILLEVAASSGERLWVEAGPQVRRLRVGDAVRLHLREVESVAFGARAGPRPEQPTGEPSAVSPVDHSAMSRGRRYGA